MNGESGESGGKVDLTGEVCDLSGVMSEVVCDSNELGENGEVMGETVELGEAGETGDKIQTGEQGTVGQVMGGLDGPGIAAGERGEGEVSTGERGEGGVSTGEQGEGAVSTGEQGEGGVSTGERGEEAVSAGEGTSGASEWWLVPAKRRNKRKSAMKDKGGKTGRLEDTAVDTDTSDCGSISDGSELSGTMPEGQEIDLYPSSLFKKFLTQTKGMKGLDLGTYFPDRLRFIRARDARKRALVFDTAKRKRIDVLFLQETHSDCGIKADWEKEWEGQVLLSHNTTLSGGVGLLFSRGFTPLSLEVEHVDTRRSIKDLEMEIVELEAIGSSTGDRGCIETLQSKKMAFASLLDSQVQGALVRSRIKDLTEMDAPSSFFFGLEKKRGQNLIIHSLLSSTGQELVEPGQIRQRAVEFFSSLYESEYRSDDGLFHEFCGDLPRISEEANSQLDRPLQLDELHAALLSMKGRKSPGVDGLTVEFFKAYWDIVAHDMLEVFNESLASGSLPLSCRRAVVTLLPKKGNLREIKNWRPVSLLCVDYRILSKTLASRLREAMEQVIHRDQTYCVPGRSITRKRLLTGLKNQFLWKVMERFGFSPGFIAMIRVLYCDIASMLKFNGSLCPPFRVRRGVRQGCALSGMLSPSNPFSLGVNWQKSEALAVGRWTNGLPVLPQDLAWRRDGLKYLGVFIGDEETEKKNWLDTLEKVDRKIQKWEWLLPRMSYRGRTLVLNNLVASVLWHRLSCMEPPSGLLAQLQTRVLAFFWDGMHWVQQGVLYLPREEGGQGLIHLASRTAAFRIQFVQRFLTGPADLCGEMWLTAALWRTRTLLLQHVVAVAGPDLTGAEAVGSLLGIRSTQAAEGVLRLWRNRLSTRERRILEDYGQGTEPDSEDPFPEIRLVAHLGNLDGPLLRPAKTFSLVAVDKKTLYNDCVRVLNRRGLSNRSTSMWADRLGGDGARPCWRVLYKPPLKTRTGDLQWRILHGAVALNALLSRMNTAVSDQCQFCSGRETVVHAWPSAGGSPYMRLVLLQVSSC
ncbi:Transposon TX1 uncharacterized 149 kDa protein ORF 2 [Takifugu flavidus]|uniref:Transposon TX1 uncharacterized 149 kDa protein ORF 2 n=1 Tax=Takifugu flavidus TaxID=433684 RepID=A0A5C6N1A9_9TELE|nr:Transposon TX1 uncharacterized 149 kDa protein ORF 2 [Takifugu flavidus]